MESLFPNESKRSEEMMSLYCVYQKHNIGLYRKRGHGVTHPTA